MICPNEGCGQQMRTTASPDFRHCPKCGHIRVKAPTPKFDLKESERARDEALEGVTQEPFSSRVATYLAENVSFGRRFTGEDIRRWCTEADIHPHHSNAWGGVISGLLRSGTIQATGERRKMEDVRSHARKTDVYERVPA